MNFNFIGITLDFARIVELMQAGDLAFVRKLIDEGKNWRGNAAVSPSAGAVYVHRHPQLYGHRRRDIAVTSGNSLTVGMGVQGLLKAAGKRDPPRRRTLGVVGAGGTFAAPMRASWQTRFRIVLFGNRGPAPNRSAIGLHSEFIETCSRICGIETGNRSRGFPPSSTTPAVPGPYLKRRNRQ